MFGARSLSLARAAQFFHVDRVCSAMCRVGPRLLDFERLPVHCSRLFLVPGLSQQMRGNSPNGGF
jgi:hypothetical protein